jgi:hypothetical protein
LLRKESFAGESPMDQPVSPRQHGALERPEAHDISGPRDPVIARLLEYWDGKRAGRLMPSRADMDPLVELRALVSHVITYDVVEPGRLYRIRLVGQAIVDFVGFDATGTLAGQTLPPEAAQQDTAPPHPQRMPAPAAGIAARTGQAEPGNARMASGQDGGRPCARFGTTDRERRTRS